MPFHALTGKSMVRAGIFSMEYFSESAFGSKFPVAQTSGFCVEISGKDNRRFGFLNVIKFIDNHFCSLFLDRWIKIKMSICADQGGAIFFKKTNNALPRPLAFCKAAGYRWRMAQKESFLKAAFPFFFIKNNIILPVRRSRRPLADKMILLHSFFKKTIWKSFASCIPIKSGLCFSKKEMNLCFRLSQLFCPSSALPNLRFNVITLKMSPLLFVSIRIGFLKHFFLMAK